MNHINKNKAGLTLGTITGGGHLVWSILIALGWAQPFMSFILKVHMINAPFTVESFNAGYAIVLVIVTAIMGYISGYFFAYVWNRIHK